MSRLAELFVTKIKVGVDGDKKTFKESVNRGERERRRKDEMMTEENEDAECNESEQKYREEGERT